MTPDRLRELRRVAEAATPGKRVVVVPDSRRGHEWLILQVDGSVSSVIAAINKWARNMSTVDYCDADAEFFATFDPPTVLAMLDEIERLRREREALAAGLIDSEECVKVLLDLFPDDVRPGVAGVVDRMGRRRRTALALLDGEKGGVGDGR